MIVKASDLRPGMRVAVTQQIAARNYTLSTAIEGTVIAQEQKSTGSWYAHGKDDRLWLDRLVLKKADGEITTLNLDQFTRIDLLEPAAVSTGS